MVRFILNIFDKQGKGYLIVPEVDALVRMLYNTVDVPDDLREILVIIVMSIQIIPMCILYS